MARGIFSLNKVQLKQDGDELELLVSSAKTGRFTKEDADKIKDVTDRLVKNIKR